MEICSRRVVLDNAARDLLSRNGEDTVEHTLGLIVSGATAAIPHVEWAGISLLERDGTVTAHAPSDDVVAELDQLQNELGEGPCRDAIHDQERVLIDDMSTVSEQWPKFAPAAFARGIGSMCSFQLFTSNDGTAGALNLYAAAPGVFDAASLDTGALFASHAAIALHGAQRVAGLNVALRSRDVIGMAKGILIERFTLSEDAAFAMLVRSSQDTNLKLHAVAEWLVGEATHGRTDPATPERTATRPYGGRGVGRGPRGSLALKPTTGLEPGSAQAPPVHHLQPTRPPTPPDGVSAPRDGSARPRPPAPVIAVRAPTIYARRG